MIFNQPLTFALLVLALLLSNLGGGIIQMYCYKWDKKRGERAAVTEEKKEWKPL